MLQPTLVFVLLVAIAVAGAEVQRRMARRGLRLLTVEGPVWIGFGWILGNAATGLFPDDILDVLRAVVLVGLAWIGLVFGMQIDVSVMRRLESWHRRVGLALPTAVGFALLAAAYAASWPPALALGLAALGMVSSPATIDAVARSRPPADRSAFRLLRMVSAFSGIPAVVMLGAASLMSCPLAALGGGVLPWWVPGIGQIAIGVLAGYSIVVLVRGVTDDISLLTIVAGCVALMAGAAALLGVSPLPTSVVAGAVVVNRCFFPQRVLRTAHSFERPLLVAMLVLVGATMSELSFAWGVFVLLTLARFGANLMAGAWLRGLARRQGHEITTPLIGNGLLAQGALGMGMAVALVNCLETHDGILEAATAAIVTNQIAAEIWTRRVLFSEDGNQ